MTLIRRQLNTTGEILGKKSEFNFIDPPLIDAPHTDITDLSGNPRKLPDPSLTLRPALGIDRLGLIRSLEIDHSLKGPGGEAVYRPHNNDVRVRFVGSWDNITNTSGNYIQTTTVDDFIEVTFYGTGLNIVEISSGAARDYRATVDGGAESANLFSTHDDILLGRNYNMNLIRPIVSGLSLGIHTVKIRMAAGVFSLSGLEIVNEEDDIQVPSGEVFANGRKYTHALFETSAYNSGFDGSPALNGRGGRVVEYIDQAGSYKKAIQQAESSALLLDAADHSSEEEIGRINFREFGANRADDFNTLSTGTEDVAFTLDDGTTTLIGHDVQVNAANTDALNTTGGSVGFTKITFVGTGLDIVQEAVGVGTSAEFELAIDSTVETTIPPEDINGIEVKKIVSGLPYGTHTVRLRRTDNVNIGRGIRDFIIYGPKKPSIPDDAVAIQEYYLMADFDNSALVGTSPVDNLETPQGVLRKMNTREFYHASGVFTASLSVVDNPSGFFVFDNSTGNTIEYTFCGTGLVIRLMGTNTGTYSFQVAIDGVLNDTGVALTNVTNDGGGTYTTTSATTDAPINLEFTGLSFGIHTVTIASVTNARNLGGGCLDIITPIHYPNTKNGSLSMGPGVQLQKETVLGGTDLGKAKAWVIFDQQNNEILDSFNLSAVVDLATGVHAIYWDRPFKRNPLYLTTITGSTAGDILAALNITAIDSGNGNITSSTRHGIRVQSRNSNSGVINTFDSNYICVAAFGELADEDEE